jgi:hypothetical protein
MTLLTNTWNMKSLLLERGGGGHLWNKYPSCATDQSDLDPLISVIMTQVSRASRNGESPFWSAYNLNLRQ